MVLAGMACATAPDVDVVGFLLGVRYGDVLGHRGLTHSVFFTAALSAALACLLWPMHPGVAFKFLKEKDNPYTPWRRRHRRWLDRGCSKGHSA